jgi:hypothetical protein
MHVYGGEGEGGSGLACHCVLAHDYAKIGVCVSESNYVEKLIEQIQLWGPRYQEES